LNIEDKARNGISLDVQKTKIKAYAELRDLQFDFSDHMG
jgi:hypothetical protein